MRLRDLLADPALHLRLLHGGEDVLDRPLRWVCTTDLPEPGRYLSGGELVLTGLVWRSRPQDSERFVAAVTAAGAVALGAGDARFGEVPQDLLDACRRHDLPLLEVPEDVAFAAVTERVMGAMATERGDRLAASVGRHRRLLAAFAEGRGLDEMTALVSAETGLVCRVLTASGRQVVDAGAPLTGEVLDAVSEAFLGADRLPVRTSGAGHPAYSLFPVGSALQPRVGSWLVAVEGDWAQWDAEPTEAVTELAAIAALDRARREEGVRVARHIADDAVALVASGEGARQETQVRLRQAGWPAGAPTTVAVAQLEGAGGPDAVCAVLEDAAAHLGPALVARAEGDLAVALVAAGDGAAGEVLRAGLGRLAAGLHRARLSVGVSRPADQAALSGAFEEARHALRLAELAPGPVSVVTGTDVTSHVGLLATVPDDVRRGFARGVLGEVLSYDAEHGAGLRDTLETWLELAGSWSRTAEVLHLHVNTVRYRISRVEQLTGRDLARLEDRVDVFLALRSL